MLSGTLLYLFDALNCSLVYKTRNSGYGIECTVTQVWSFYWAQFYVICSFSVRAIRRFLGCLCEATIASWRSTQRGSCCGGSSPRWELHLWVCLYCEAPLRWRCAGRWRPCWSRCSLLPGDRWPGFLSGAPGPVRGSHSLMWEMQQGNLKLYFNTGLFQYIFVQPYCLNSCISLKKLVILYWKIFERIF